MSRTRLVPVAQVGEGDARERHLDEGRALVAQGPRDAVKLHHQTAGTLQLRIKIKLSAARPRRPAAERHLPCTVMATLWPEAVSLQTDLSATLLPTLLCSGLSATHASLVCRLAHHVSQSTGISISVQL